MSQYKNIKHMFVDKLHLLAEDENARYSLHKSEGENILRLFFHIMDYSFDGYLLSDCRGRVFYANKAVERISRIPLEEIIGKTAKEMLEEGITLTNSTKILDKEPLSITQKVKTGVEVLITSVPVYDENGGVSFYVANYREMSELNKLKDIVNGGIKKYPEAFLTELKELRNKLLETDDIIVRSAKMKKVLESVLKVAPVDVNVLVTGESGVGKEIIAKLIHKYSSRKSGPYVQINCGAIPGSLLESELFGYEKGAFSGAQKGKMGLLEVANKGTILFDEIGDLPLGLQVKILRAIENKEVYRLGGVKPIKLDLRIIAATHKELQAMVEAETFRKDLFYRLHVVNLKIPSLKERKDDIIPLAYHFIKTFNEKYKTNKVFTPEVCNALEGYEWPGNVRELQNTIENMVIFNEGPVIKMRCLPQHISRISHDKDNNDLQFEEGSDISLKKAVETVEKRLISSAMKQHKTVRRAATSLGVTHSTVIRKIKRYKLDFD
ncbi:sigma 54-interacting transcriptional regulator [Metallumcola ferriviriculae]|uniref:HTH-type transcriptional regulatory protein TyrR n=1 Tax=Metallumcola ferriviriculae TaxID=3039180 RepID=A0AAU0UPI0_9FIRM|nr:sigma 54-interacting transcriptional regulator [Desulfitibacteraceae bacterium MK1]